MVYGDYASDPVRFKRLRESKGWSQREVAQVILHCNPSSVSGFECGKYPKNLRFNYNKLDEYDKRIKEYRALQESITNANTPVSNTKVDYSSFKDHKHTSAEEARPVVKESKPSTSTVQSMPTDSVKEIVNSYNLDSIPDKYRENYKYALEYLLKSMGNVASMDPNRYHVILRNIHGLITIGNAFGFITDHSKDSK